MTMRVFVCDDEPLAVRRICVLLEEHPDVELAGSTSDPREAAELIGATAPDLLLLDVEMPEVDGFDIVDRLSARPDRIAPLVAFVTAYRRFAPDAFESGAIDFLPKPVRARRLETTLARARDALAGREARDRLAHLERTLPSLRVDHAPAEREHVWVSRRGEMVRIDLDRIERVEAEGAYVRLHVETASYLHREAIGAIEGRLDAERFVRVHRSHLVRADQVASIRRTFHGASELVVRDGVRVPLGRKYAKAARRRLLASRGVGEAD